MKNRTYNRRKVFVVFLLSFVMLAALALRLVHLMVFEADYYQELADDLHERERSIKAARGRILDRNGVVLADNKTVCTVSVIHSQIEDEEEVTRQLSAILELSEDEVRKKVEKVSSMERIQSNVEKEKGDEIRALSLSGVKVDEDYKRYYPYGTLASRVLGFTGADNQGIVGIEVKYEDDLKGTDGRILTTTDARGVEIEGIAEDRVEPVDGNDLTVSLDYNLQKYAQQAAEKVMEEKDAEGVGILLMDPDTGEILAMVNAPEFDLNAPYELTEYYAPDGEADDETKQELLNQMWRNRCINDTYEPGSTFKIITSSACLSAGTVSLEDSFSCPGYRIVEDRRIRCHKVGGHGTETFVQGLQNSCNPVFIDIGLKLGAERFYDYLEQFGLMDKTGVDLPGEAGTIIHRLADVGEVELATMTFGQSFQITPLRLAATVSAIINGGRMITPHLGVSVSDRDGNVLKSFSGKKGKRILSEETSETMRELLESVVSEGSGKNGAVKGYRIGGKTATSQTLPRSANRYISSFLAFAPADDPEILGLIVIYDPKGTYYGGTIAAPVMADIFSNILPYLGIDPA